MAKAGSRKAAGKSNPLDNLIRDELKAAFAWAQMTATERAQFKKDHSSSFRDILEHAVPSRAFDAAAFTAQAGKKNFGEYLSKYLASRFAAALVPTFPGILPDPEGKGHESRARTSKGYKKLDVNYSTPELGLGLGVSIKTINSIDEKSGRYTKNYTRVDAELRAEAADYHERQPYATMVAVIFLPLDSSKDAKRDNPSSFGAAVRLFRNRSGRYEASDSNMLFERVYVGLYDTDPAHLGDVQFVDVNSPPPKVGPPRSPLTFREVVSGIINTYDERNSPPFIWDDGEVTKDEAPDPEVVLDSEEGEDPSG